MNIKIWPRKKNDKGGYACMPLKKNVPEGHDGWRLEPVILMYHHIKP